MQTGCPVPNVTLKTRVRDEAIGGDNPFRWQDVSTGDLFAEGRHVVFALPGAFTPTCTTQQCPAYERTYDDFKAEGVADVYCLSVNDAFVMYQWGKFLDANNVKMLPDGSGDFTRRMGMLIKKDHVGFGARSWRYAMVIDDGVVTEMFVEPGLNDDGSDSDPYGESKPEPVLEWVKANPYKGAATAAARELEDA